MSPKKVSFTTDSMDRPDTVAMRSISEEDRQQLLQAYDSDNEPTPEMEESEQVMENSDQGRPVSSSFPPPPPPTHTASAPMVSASNNFAEPLLDRARSDPLPYQQRKRRATVKERMSIFSKGVYSNAVLGDHHANIVREGIAVIFITLIFVLYWMMRRVDREYESTMELDFPIMLSAILMIAGTTRLSDTNTIGERILLSMVCSIVLMVATFLMFVVTSPCAHCVHMSASHAVNSASDISLLQSKQVDLWKAWNIVLSPDDDDDAHTVACRRCISNVMTLFVFDGWVGYVKKRMGLKHNGMGPSALEQDDKKNALLEMEIEHKSIHEDIGDLAAWYVHYENVTKSEDTTRFKKKVAEILEQQGHMAGDDLSEAMSEYLCSPSSRVDKPDPVKFLEDIRNSRFTGEDNLSNMSTTTLQKIMRGDMLKELGVSVCFMLRFALQVPKDYSIEYKPISHTHFSPMATEKELKSVDISTHLPGVVMPQKDQDIDRDGSEILTFKKIMGIFDQFPYEDKAIYFDTKEEYLAFYRWELENSIQDDWYFPQWLLQGEKAEAVADLMAAKLKYSPDHLTLENPQEDQTMSDRVFYGTGQKYLTPIKLPGIDEDHDYLFPARGKDMLTAYHREQFRYTKKPATQDLLRMIKSFHPDKVNDNTTLLDWKNKVLQIDFAVIATLPSRPDFYSPGSMLYIDADSKMPMGIWESTRERMFLPTEGRDWTHAKYFWRVSERAALAGSHVAESHFGWSHPVSTAAWQTLPHTHGIRTLLKPFTLNVHSVNSAAYNMLIRDHSVLTHGAGVVTKGVNDVFHIMLNGLNFSQTVPEALDAHGLDGVIDTSDMPLFSQGRRLYDVHHQFVESFVSMVYKSDEEMLQDDAIVRFWHHVNTYGRHMDPCVCAMDSDIFFDDNGQWPQNEDTKTCEELLDFSDYLTDKNLITRRRQWCTKQEPFDRIKALRKLIEKTCKQKDPDCRILYDLHLMREDMSMKPLKTREQLINFIATFVWEVTAGHQFNGDNISYFADPEHSGVRMREFDNKGELPITTDLGTYVFGTSIASLTTIRSPPVLADWSPLYSYYASTKKQLTSKDRNAFLQKLNQIHLSYKHKLFDLSVDFLNESISRPKNQRSNVFIPAVQLSSVSV